uniref:Uncharacterized protein n=1 Tax=Anopheles melas TaxID=34690 RepID=A0A182TS39_9DIPT
MKSLTERFYSLEAPIFTQLVVVVVLLLLHHTVPLADWICCEHDQMLTVSRDMQLVYVTALGLFGTYEQHAPLPAVEFRELSTVSKFPCQFSPTQTLYANGILRKEKK